MRKILCSTIALYFCANLCANASFMDALNVINATGRTINTINSAGRGTMSTVEYAQRFQDRQQDRQDYKRAQKGYNADAQEEYYRTIQETKALEAKYQETKMLNVDL